MKKNEAKEEVHSYYFDVVSVFQKNPNWCVHKYILTSALRIHINSSSASNITDTYNYLDWAQLALIIEEMIDTYWVEAHGHGHRQLKKKTEREYFSGNKLHVEGIPKNKPIDPPGKWGGSHLFPLKWGILAGGWTD